MNPSPTLLAPTLARPIRRKPCDEVASATVCCMIKV